MSEKPEKSSDTPPSPSSPQPAESSAGPSPSAPVISRAEPATLNYAKGASPIPRLTRVLLIVAGLMWMTCAIACALAAVLLLALTDPRSPLLVARPTIIAPITAHFFVGTIALLYVSVFCLVASRGVIHLAAAFALHLFMVMLSLAPMVVVTGLRMCQDAHIGLLLATGLFAVYFVPLIFLGVLCLLHLFPLSVRKLRPDDLAIVAGRSSVLGTLLTLSALHVSLFFGQCFRYSLDLAKGSSGLRTLAICGFLLGVLTTIFLRRRRRLSVIAALLLYGLTSWLIITSVMDRRFILEPNNLLGIGLIVHMAILCLGHVWYAKKCPVVPPSS